MRRILSQSRKGCSGLVSILEKNPRSQLETKQSWHTPYILFRISFD